MLNFYEFVEKVKEIIKTNLEEKYHYEDVEILVNKCDKINYSYQAITFIRKGTNISPAFNMNEMYENYKNNSWSYVEEIIEDILKTISYTNKNADMTKLLDYNFIKNKLFIRVSAIKFNQHLINTVPFTKVEDLMITYHIFISGDDGVSSIMITNDILKKYDISISQLHADSMVSSSKLFPVRIESVLEAPMLLWCGQEDNNSEECDIVSRVNDIIYDELPIVVVTNNKLLDGAASIFYFDVMDKIGEGCKSNYYILPSSINEVMIIPDDGFIDIEVLRNMVKTVNHDTVNPKEWLSDEIYYYNIDTKVFSIAKNR